MFIATVILSALLAVVYAAAGSSKLPDRPKNTEMAAHIGLPPGRLRVIGLLEIAAAAGLLIGLFWAPLGAAAAAGLVLLMAGAFIGHIRVKDPVKAMAPALTLGILAAVTFVLRIATG
ncbi:DoxX family protein [Streptomyces sp. NPDC093109]|uniref:DoxX family protein n=1 Tax=Streptomyces sp. NPDC093109 TaxID=3154977 RepID=UPI00344CB7E5